MMLGTKLLLIFASILLVEAQYSSPRVSNGYSRVSSFRRPFVRPRPAPVVTSVPNVPITTEKIEIITEPQPPIIHPIEKDNTVHETPVIIPPQPTELTIIYPENYKPATSSPPEPSSRSRNLIRLPSSRPRPVQSNNEAPTTTLPPPPTPSHFNFMPRFPAYVTSQPAVIPESAKPVEPIGPTPEPQEPVPEPSKSLPKPIEPVPKPIESVPEPSESVPKPIESVPEPIESVPEPIESIPEPIEYIPEPIESTPEPIESIPEPSKPVPKPSLETFEPPAPSAIIPPIVTDEPVIILPPASTTVKPIEYRQPEIISPTVVPSEIPKEISPTDDSVKPFSDIDNPPVSESGSAIVEENNPLYNKPMINWYPAQQKPIRPIPTLAVPSTTEVYSYIPTTATIKPIVRPVSTSKPWSKPSEDLYANRLHDYNCRNSDGYESVLNQCDAYVECKQNMAHYYVCPDGLHFNPAVKWPEYPCGYPSEVKCESQAVTQEPRPTAQCPHRYGFYPIPDGDCGQYIMCQEGLATIMSCPPGLAFSSITSSCDWPANVPGCNPNIFQGFTCPAPSLDKYGKQINNSPKYRYKNSCKQYIACHKGNPRLLSCDAGTSFDAESEACVDADQVVDCQY